jgi:hypothetical protein
MRVYEATRRGARMGPDGRERKVDRAVESTFPASDPAAAGRATGTEAPSRPTDRQAPVVSREEIERASKGGASKPMGRPSAGVATMKPAPGDDAAPGTPGTGEDICPQCRGSGKVGANACPHCEGLGTVTKGIGGA